MYYAFTQVLGSLELDEVEFSEGILSTGVKVLFVFLTNVVLLNFLVSILANVYAQSRKTQRKDRLLIMHWYGKEAGIRCAVPPFSICSHFIWIFSPLFPGSMQKCAKVLEKVAFSLTFFPVGLGLKIIVDCASLFPEYIRGFILRSETKSHLHQSSEQKGTVIVDLQQSCKREIALWAAFGLFSLLFRILEDWITYIQTAYKDPISLPSDRLDTTGEELMNPNICEEPQSPQQEKASVYIYLKPAGASVQEFAQQLCADRHLAGLYAVSELLESVERKEVVESVRELEKEVDRLEGLGKR